MLGHVSTRVEIRLIIHPVTVGLPHAVIQSESLRYASTQLQLTDGFKFADHNRDVCFSPHVFFHALLVFD